MSNYNALILAETGLVSYWRLGEAVGATTATDAVGTNNGTYVNTPTLAVAGALKDDADSAVTFAAASTQRVLAKSGFIIAGSGNFTIEAWAKTSATTQDMAIYAERAGSGNDIFKMEFAELNGTPAGELRAVYRDDAGTIHFVDSGLAVNDGNYHHCVWTMSGTTFQMYIDGVAKGSSVTRTATLTFTNASPESRIAGDAGDGNAFLTGTVDEVAVYTVALTAAQIARHYAVGRQAAYVYKPVIIPNRRVGPIALRRTFRAPVVPIANLPIATTALAEVATGTGAANNASAQIQPNAAAATGTGAASNAAASIAPAASSAAGTGAANNATVSIVATSSVAAGTGAAANAQSSIVASAALASGTGAALPAAAQVAAAPSAATGTGAASGASASIVVLGGLTSGTGAANDATVSVSANAAFAAGTGSAYDATVSTIGDVVALAEVAQGVGTAYDATVVIPVVGGGAGKFGRRYNPVQIAKPLEIPSPFVIAHAEVARGTGRAYDATVSWNDDDFALMLLEAA